jgi:hypothetical protein
MEELFTIWASVHVKATFTAPECSCRQHLVWTMTSLKFLARGRSRCFGRFAEGFLRPEAGFAALRDCERNQA